MNCGHTFSWMSLLPPTHCPVCGACLHCGNQTWRPAPTPVMPYQPWPYPRPYWSDVTCTSGTSTNALVAA